MTDQDRGAYTPPTDAPLSFDARQPVRGSRPVPLTLIASGLVLILLVGSIVMFYRSGVREAGQAPATVGEAVGPMTAPAPADAQPSDPAAGLQIYKQGDTPGAPNFVPPPDQPQVRPAPVTPPVQTAQLPPASPASAGLKPAQPPPKTAPAPLPKTAPAPPPKIAPPPPAPIAKAAPPASSGTFAVQIGAFSSQAQADKGYVDAGRITGADIAGKTKRVEQIEKDGATLYRTAVVGFATRTQASAFCAQLKAAGKNCFVK